MSAAKMISEVVPVDGIDPSTSRSHKIRDERSTTELNGRFFQALAQVFI